MADDINVVFGADTTQLDAAVDKVKREVQSLVPGAAGSGILTPLPPGLGGPPKPPIPPGGGYRLLTDDERAAARGANELSQAGRGITEEFGKMAEGFFKWGLLWKVFETGLNAVIDGFKQFNDETQIARQAQNAFGLSSAEAQSYLEMYREAARSVGMSWDEWTKFAPPALQALEGVGLGARDAMIETRELADIFEKTGVDLRKLAPAVELGTASFQQLAEADRLMGPAWAQQVSALEHLEAGERNYQRELSHTHTLERQALSDAEELDRVRVGFASKSGIEEAAFGAFAKAGGRPSPYIRMPKGLDPNDFKQLTKEMEQQFAEGAAQMAKELQIPLSHVQRYITTGIPGFDQQSVMAAQKRAIHESDVTGEREQQEQSYKRAKEFEDARLTLNTQVKDALADQNKFLAAQPDLIKATVIETNKLVDSLHDLDTARKGVGPVSQVPGLGAVDVAGLSIPSWAYSGVMAKGPAPVAGAAQPSGELKTHDETTAGKLDDLIRMLEGH